MYLYIYIYYSIAPYSEYKSKISVYIYCFHYMSPKMLKNQRFGKQFGKHV